MPTNAGNVFPRNVEELVKNKSWMRKIRLTVSKFNFGDRSISTDDAVQAILCRMVKRKDAEGRDFVARWDPTKGAFSTWIYMQVHRTCIQMYNKGNKTPAGIALGTALSLVNRLDDSSDTRLDGLNLDSYLGAATFTNPDLGPQIDQVVEELSQEPTRSWVEYTDTGVFIKNKSGSENRFIEMPVPQNLRGKTFNRDLRTVFSLLCAEFTVEDISEVLKVSRSYVYYKLGQLREIPSLKTWKKSIDGKEKFGSQNTYV